MSFDEAKHRRSGNGTFAVKAFSEADGATDALSDHSTPPTRMERFRAWLSGY